MSAVSQNHDKDTEFLTSNTEIEHSSLIESDKEDASMFSKLPQKSSCFPPSARAFVDAINKNRSMQKFLGIKLREIEAKIEANKKLRDRVKVMKDFQAACIRKTRSALSLKKDPRVQLISAKKSSAPNNSKAGSGLVGEDDALGSGGVSAAGIESSYMISLRDMDMMHVKDFTFVHGGAGKA